MALRIDADRSRFKNIVKGKVRKNLKKYLTQDSIVGKSGKGTVNIPIPNINIPKFRHGDGQGGVSQGDGSEGDPIDGSGPKKPGKGKVGEGEGEHEIETEISMDEMIDLISEELALPNLENKGKKEIQTQSIQYNGINRTGSEGLRHFKRTYKEAIKREIGSGTYVPGKAIVPRHEDKRYRSASPKTKEVASAAVIYMMDVSGSMGEEQKQIVRAMSFWMNGWIKKQYKGLETRYIIHDSSARMVDEDTFFRTSESGGTNISSAYRLCIETMKEFPFNEWNVYAFHFSDGDNWSGDDTAKCMDIVRDGMLPGLNMFGYGQVDSPYGSGQFIHDLRDSFAGEEKLITTKIPTKDDVMRGIKDFLGKGK